MKGLSETEAALLRDYARVADWCDEHCAELGPTWVLDNEEDTAAQELAARGLVGYFPCAYFPGDNGHLVITTLGRQALAIFDAVETADE